MANIVPDTAPRILKRTLEKVKLRANSNGECFGGINGNFESSQSGKNFERLSKKRRNNPPRNSLVLLTCPVMKKRRPADTASETRTIAKTLTPGIRPTWLSP